MKLACISIFLFLNCYLAYCQNQTTDTSRKIIVSIEQRPEFPGGNDAFLRFIQINFNYPQAMQIIGTIRKMRISFTVGTDGKLTNVHALDTIGAGCGAEAIRVIASSPRWKPAMVNGTPVKINFTVAVAFSAPKDSINMRELTKAAYGFIFEINGSLCTIGQAAGILGVIFPSNRIELVSPIDDKKKYNMPDKIDIYLIKIKP
jgi:protein TonB